MQHWGCSWEMGLSTDGLSLAVRCRHAFHTKLGKKPLWIQAPFSQVLPQENSVYLNVDCLLFLLNPKPNKQTKQGGFGGEGVHSNREKWKIFWSIAPNRFIIPADYRRCQGCPFVACHRQFCQTSAHCFALFKQKHSYVNSLCVFYPILMCFDLIWIAAVPLVRQRAGGCDSNRRRRKRHWYNELFLTHNTPHLKLK